MVFRNLKSSFLWKNAKGVTAIGRHSIKGDATIEGVSSGLSEAGILKAKNSAKRLPAGFRVFVSHGEQKRHLSTAKLMLESYEGFKAENVRLAEDLGFKCMKNVNAIEERIKATSDAQVLADWVDGKISKDIIADPVQTGRAVLKYSLGETEKLISSSKERPLHLNLTSSWFDGVVLKALGIDYRSIKPKNLREKEKPLQGETFKPTEAILFFHVPRQGIAMRYRGRPFDVTKQLLSILK